MNRPILNLSQDLFEAYGTIIEYTDQKNDGWEIIIKDESPGWRIALLEFSRKGTTTLEHHPKSKESFEPLSGMSLLIVAEYERPEDYKVFLLDKPICLNPCVWHQVISLSEQTQVKITENLDVDCVYYELDQEVRPSI